MARPTKIELDRAFIAWCKAMKQVSYYKNKAKVQSDLEANKDLSIVLGERVSSFISWAAEERLNHTENIKEEVFDFLNGNFSIRKRMYSTDVKKWNKIRAYVFIRDKFTCSYCGDIGGFLEVDHIHAFSKGGSDELENLCTACRKCNRRKKDKSVAVFTQSKINKNAK